MSYLFVLVWLCTYAAAAPPLNLPSLALFSTTNTTFPLIRNISLSAGRTFPPYPELPHFYIYPVPNTNTILKFQRDALDPERSETEVRAAIANAIVDNIGHTDRQALIPTDDVYEYESGGNVVMELFPDPEEDQEQALTWEVWMNALNGVASYAEAYPGLYFGFYIYAGSAGPGDRFVGSGVLISYF